jgi:hypothetical protein
MWDLLDPRASEGVKGNELNRAQQLLRIAQGSARAQLVNPNAVVSYPCHPGNRWSFSRMLDPHFARVARSWVHMISRLFGDET